jgi:hypothetical protein
MKKMLFDDRYDMRPPLISNAIDIFQGEWAGGLPGFENPNLPRFYNDPRIAYFDEQIGGFIGKTILELGPLEASHTYAMLARGAHSVLAIEANRKSFLKCLIVKEALGLHGAKFVLGDFCQYLTREPARFDVIVASGVLYHMSDPLALIESMTKAADSICIWTHYYDRERIKVLGYESRFSAPAHIRFRSSMLIGSEQTYPQQALAYGGFCGGAERKTLWLELDSIRLAFAELGFSIQIGKDEADHPSGPAVWIVATKI